VSPKVGPDISGGLWRMYKGYRHWRMEADIHRMAKAQQDLARRQSEPSPVKSEAAAEAENPYADSSYISPIGIFRLIMFGVISLLVICAVLSDFKYVPDPTVPTASPTAVFHRVQHKHVKRPVFRAW
jgi:hypothetical protein